MKTNALFWLLFLAAFRVCLAADDLNFQMREFQFELGPKTGRPAPAHQVDGHYKYEFNSYVFPDSTPVITAIDSGGTSPILNLLSSFVAAAQTGDIEKISKCYTPEDAAKFVQMYGRPDTTARAIQNYSTLQGLKPVLAVKTDQERMVIWTKTMRDSKLSDGILLPLIVAKTNSGYALKVGNLGEGTAMTNLISYLMTPDPMKGLKISL